MHKWANNWTPDKHFLAGWLEPNYILSANRGVPSYFGPWALAVLVVQVSLAIVWPHLAHPAGKNQNGLYEPLLEDREREAVSDLLSFLENVRGDHFLCNITLLTCVAQWCGLLHRCPSQSLNYFSLLWQCRLAKKCCIGICRDYRERRAGGRSKCTWAHTFSSAVPGSWSSACCRCCLGKSRSEQYEKFSGLATVLTSHSWKQSEHR